MTRHICQLNDSNGFSCNVCETRREAFVTEFDRDYLPKLSALLKDMRVPVGIRVRCVDDLTTAYVEARMEDGDAE